MPTLEEIIRREVNPFDPVTFKTGNFWTEDKQALASAVDSIHREAIVEIQSVLDATIEDGCTRTILLTGDSGCGKSYLLNRLKTSLNSRAFFAYIDPPPSNDFIWQHTLRYVVDSLMHVPEGEKESQLVLWLKNLPPFQDSSWTKRFLGEKRHFIRELRNIFPTNLYQARDFLAVLYELTKDNYLLACDWLRGENLDNEELKLLGVNSVVNTEEVARGILGNIAKISLSNRPIVLCFDQVELGPKLADGSLDIGYAFNINTALHNSNLKNLFIIISIIRDKLMANKKNILQSDSARIQNLVSLKAIDLKQVEALWANRLHALHLQADPKPESPIAPLSGQKLQEKYPGGKANIRDSLNFGGELYLEYLKRPKPDPLASFKLLWREEFGKTQESVSRIRQFSSQELKEMLQQAMEALQVQHIEFSFLPGRYGSFSFSYQLPKIGVLWYEEPNLTGFFHVISACRQAIEQKMSSSLVLIRAEKLGNIKNQGFKVYQQIFKNPSHQHITPDLNSVHYLKTYQRLANDARAGDLVVAFQAVNLEKLQAFIRQSKLLHECNLLQDLKIIPAIPKPIKPDAKAVTVSSEKEDRLQQVKELLLDLVKNQQFLGRQILILQAKRKSPEVDNSQIDRLIEELCGEKKIKIIDPQAKPEEQLVCYTG